MYVLDRERERESNVGVKDRVRERRECSCVRGGITVYASL